MSDFWYNRRDGRFYIPFLALALDCDDCSSVFKKINISIQHSQRGRRTEHIVLCTLPVTALKVVIFVAKTGDIMHVFGIALTSLAHAMDLTVGLTNDVESKDWSNANLKFAGIGRRNVAAQQA